MIDRAESAMSAELLSIRTVAARKPAGMDVTRIVPGTDAALLPSPASARRRRRVRADAQRSPPIIRASEVSLVPSPESSDARISGAGSDSTGVDDAIDDEENGTGMETSDDEVDIDDEESSDTDDDDDDDDDDNDDDDRGTAPTAGAVARSAGQPLPATVPPVASSPGAWIPAASGAVSEISAEDAAAIAAALAELDESGVGTGSGGGSDGTPGSTDDMELELDPER